MAIITVANQKGGVGKTTTAVTLAHGLAIRGYEVLVVDLDTQGNVSDALGIEKSAALYQWLILEEALKGVVVNARPRLDVVRSNKLTAKLKVALSGMDFREMVLANGLNCYQNYWDHVVIDCAPSVDVLHTAAMVCADLLVIPTRLDQFSVEGVVESMTSLDSVRQMTRSKCEVAGIIPTFYDRVTNESHAQLQVLAKGFNGLVWPPVAQDTGCREASRLGKTLWEMTPGRALTGYADCLDRLVKVLK